MGVEYDAGGRVVAYHIRSSAAYGSPGPNGSSYRRLPAENVIHLFDPQQVGQSRGYPRVSTSLASLKQLDAYFEAAITAARAGASKMGFIHTQDGAEYSGDDTDSTGSVLSDFEAGTIEQLPVGTDFTAFDPRYPHEQFAEFVKSMLQSISSSLGVSYSALSGDLEGVNYSSIRAGVLEEREVWKARQQWFIDGYCRPIFERWLRAALLMNAITLNGTPLAGDFDAYNHVVFQGRRWAWVDPLKDMNASIIGINNNITTVSAVIREQGRDPEEVFQERSKEKKRLAALGLTEKEVISSV
jgi:lambda family phage portal protein